MRIWNRICESDAISISRLKVASKMFSHYRLIYLRDSSLSYAQGYCFESDLLCKRSFILSPIARLNCEFKSIELSKENTKHRIFPSSQHHYFFICPLFSMAQTNDQKVCIVLAHCTNKYSYFMHKILCSGIRVLVETCRIRFFNLLN